MYLSDTCWYMLTFRFFISPIIFLQKMSGSWIQLLNTNAIVLLWLSTSINLWHSSFASKWSYCLDDDSCHYKAKCTEFFPNIPGHLTLILPADIIFISSRTSLKLKVLSKSTLDNHFDSQIAEMPCLISRSKQGDAAATACQSVAPAAAAYVRSPPACENVTIVSSSAATHRSSQKHLVHASALIADWRIVFVRSLVPILVFQYILELIFFI